MKTKDNLLKGIIIGIVVIIVPLILMDIDKRLDNYRSCVVNTVHDSIVVDVHPEEIDDVLNIIKETNNSMTDLINNNFDITLNVPLVLEAKLGNNWLDMQEVIWYNYEPFNKGENILWMKYQLKV